MGDRIVERQAVAAGAGGDPITLRMQQQQQQQQQSTNVENLPPASSAPAPLATGREGKQRGITSRVVALSGWFSWIPALRDMLSMFFPGVAR